MLCIRPRNSSQIVAQFGVPNFDNLSNPTIIQVPIASWYNGTYAGWNLAGTTLYEHEHRKVLVKMY